MFFGEALIDFLNTNNQLVDGLSLGEFRQYPGGAPANAAVAYAKLGGAARFVGQVGADKFGDFLIESLARYQVDTSCVLKSNDAPTALAFVHLDADNERSFTFFRHNTADISLAPEQIDRTWFNQQKMLHICSNTLTTQHAYQTTQYMLAQASVHNMPISFDVNLRANLWPNQTVNIESVNAIVRLASIVKFAKEEFELLSQGNKDAYIKHCLAQRCRLLVITDGGKAIEYYGRDYQGCILPPHVNVVDTTAGGDGFIGALLYTLNLWQDLDVLLTNHQAIASCIRFASYGGAHAVTQAGAMPALANYKQILHRFLRDHSSKEPILEKLTEYQNNVVF
jgi:fructokinase